MRILLAEDEMDLNDILTMKLSDAGYSVDSCLDGEEALLYLSSAARAKDAAKSRAIVRAVNPATFLIFLSTLRLQFREPFPPFSGLILYIPASHCRKPAG